MVSMAIASIASAQTTRSEKLAAGTETPSEADEVLSAERCAPLGAISKPLPVESFPVSPVYEVIWPEVLFLPLIDTHLPEGGGTTYAVSKWPDLPHGGIAGIDFCAIAFMHALNQPTPDRPNLHRFGLLLRPGLDIATDYPSVHRILTQQSDRLTIIQEGVYLMFKLSEEDKDRAAEVGKLLVGDAPIDTAISLGSWLIVEGFGG